MNDRLQKIPNGPRPPNKELGSVNNLSIAGFEDGRLWILAYCTIGPTISPSAMAGNLLGCCGSFKEGNFETRWVSAKGLRGRSVMLAHVGGDSHVFSACSLPIVKQALARLKSAMLWDVRLRIDMEVCVTQLDRPVVCLFGNGHRRYFRGWLKAYTSPAVIH
ncbi:hypothetical protein KC347_g120 [Hortaea werneckii]|nr:hypothetical protein KC347_g120 [Hortaea werneckii]